MKHLAPDYVYTPQGLQSNQIVSISDEGYICALTERGPGTEITEVLPGMALLPGFVNVYSQVFTQTWVQGSKVWSATA